MPRQDGDLKLTKSEIAAAFADANWGIAFPPILSVDQAAQLLQVPKATIYDWSARGLLRGCGRKVGKHLRFFRDRLLSRVFNEGLLTQ
jgi:excisionase family DNA binding protein